MQKEALSNAAVAWLKNNRELSIDRKDFPAEALKELEVFSVAPFYPLHLLFSQIPANKSEGFLCTGTFSLVQTEEQWHIKDLQLKDFAFTEAIPAALNNGELLSVVIPEIARFSLMVIPSEIKDLPTEQLSADESLKALDEYGNGYACGTLNSGAYYCGWFQDWRPHGEGKYVKGSFSLEGIWVNDVPSGVMTAIERNRWHYNGLWDGTPHGFGTIRFPSVINPQPDQYNGDWYEGLFNYGKFQGLGTYHWENGTEYFGNWVNGIREGNGTYKRYDGLYYDGQWKNDRFHGKGVYEWTAQNLPNPANSSAVYSGEWHEGIPVYNGLATFLKELEVSNDPNDYSEDVPPALQEEFKKLISAWEAEYRSHIFHHERAVIAATGVFFGSGAVAGLSPLLAQVAFYTSGSSLVIAATAAAPYVALIGAGVAAGYILNEVYNRQTKEREKAVATTKSKVDEEKKLGLIYGRWDRNNKLTSTDKSGQLIIRGKEGEPYDVPEKYTEQYPESDFGTGKPVYQYIGRTTQARYQCRQNEHGWALGRVFRKNGWGTPQIYHFDPKEQNIPGNELNWKIAEQHWVKVVGGPALDFDSKKNLQNKINPIGMGGFEETFGPFPSDPEDLEDFINAILECALD